MPGPWEAIQLLLVGGVMLAILGHFWWKGRMVRKSKGWPGTLGEVIQSKVVRESNDEGSFYSPRVVYRYSAGGRILEGSTVQIGASGQSGSRKQAKGVVARYPVGSQVLVYFDPQEPERACLERRGEGGWVGYVAGVVYPVMFLLLFMHLNEAREADDPVAAGGQRQTSAYVGDAADHSYSGGREKTYGPNAQGHLVGPAQFEGRFLFVEYTAPWCPAADAQAASFRDLQAVLSPGASVVFLTVLTGGEEVFSPSTRATAADWAGRHGLDPARVVAEGQSSRTVPQHALFSPSGQTLYRREGSLSAEEMARVLDRYVPDWRGGPGAAPAAR